MKSCSVAGCEVAVEVEGTACPKHRKPVVYEARRAGQGAREKANELAKKHPVQSLIGRWTLDILFRAPDYSWRVGAESEEFVGEELIKLPHGWYVRHDIMIGQRWNADHVVVGPGGAFVLDTKFRTGAVKTTKSGIRVDGRRTKMDKKVQDQAKEINARLRAAGMRSWVQPVLVFDNDVKGTREPDGVHVVGVGAVVEYLTSMPRELDDAEVERLGRILMDDATWPFSAAAVEKLTLDEADDASGGWFRRPAVFAGLAGVLAVLVLAGVTVSGAKPASAPPSRIAVAAPKPAPAPAAADATGERSPAVEAIRARYQAVGLNQRMLTKVVKEVSGMSTEGSTLVGYFDGPTLKKVEWTFLGESGQRMNEMTFHEGRMEFLFRKDSALGGGAVEEKRYYLVDNKIVWATQGKNREAMSASDIASAEAAVVELGVRAAQALRAEGAKLLFEDGKFVAAP